MPAPPEVRNAVGHIGIVEVLSKVEAEHAAQADGHVRIAGEIEIDLQGIGHGSQPGRRHGDGQQRRQEKGVVGNLGHIVGQQQFFCQTENKPGHALGKIGPRLLAVEDFIGNLHIADNGTGDELREQGHIQSQPKDVFLHGAFAVVHVEQIAHELEGEKRNTDGQGDVNGSCIHVEQQSQLLAQEGQIFEHHQQQRMEANAQGKPWLFAVWRGSVHFYAHQPRHDDGEYHQKDENRFAPGVKKQAGSQQDHIAVSAAAGQGIEVQQQHHRQKDK